MNDSKTRRVSKKRPKGLERFTVRRAHHSVQQRDVVVDDDEIAKLLKARVKEHKEHLEKHTVSRFLGKPRERLQARARELEGIDVAPYETMRFGSSFALEAYRRDLYQVNGKKTSHFRTSRSGLTLKIWRDE